MTEQSLERVNSQSRVATFISSVSCRSRNQSDTSSFSQLLATIEPLDLTIYDASSLLDWEKVGEGASYRVFKGEDAINRKVVAIKQVMLPSGQPQDREFQSRVDCVLKDLEIMNHNPLSIHKNFLTMFGYGWGVEGGNVIPFLVTLQPLELLLDQRAALEKQEWKGKAVLPFKSTWTVAISGRKWAAMTSILKHCVPNLRSPEGLEVSQDLHWPVGGALLLFAIDDRNEYLLSTFQGRSFNITPAENRNLWRLGDMTGFCKDWAHESEVHRGGKESLKEIFQFVARHAKWLKKSSFRERKWTHVVLDEMEKERELIMEEQRSSGDI